MTRRAWLKSRPTSADVGAMAKAEPRFAEVLRRECEGDGQSAVAAFESWKALEESYPEVAEALDADADRRGMSREKALAMGRAALVALVGQPDEKKPSTKKGKAKDDQQGEGDKPSDPPGA